MEEVARMVQRHDDHDQAANNVDGVDAFFHRLGFPVQIVYYGLQYTTKDAFAKGCIAGMR